MQPARNTAIALVALLVAGCTTSDPQFGRVVQHNIVAQAVDLEPTYAGVPIEGGSGQRAAGAVARYLRGAVKEGAVGGGGSGAAPPAAAPPS